MGDNPFKDEYTSYYAHKGCYDGKLGLIYNLREDKINNIRCKMWSCPKCRRILKWNLYHNIFYICKSLDLQRHFVITFQGKKYREKYSPTQSFYIMQKLWKKYRQVIEYHYFKKNNSKGKAKYYDKKGLDYILLPRSQNDGYCHYHIILPEYISWYFLNSKRKKYKEMGYVSINKNQDLADYLHKDFFRDSEYWIPRNINHHVCSRSYKFINFYDEFFDDDNVYRLRNRENAETFYSDFENECIDKFGRLPNNSYFLRKFYDENKDFSF